MKFDIDAFRALVPTDVHQQLAFVTQHHETELFDRFKTALRLLRFEAVDRADLLLFRGVRFTPAGVRMIVHFTRQRIFWRGRYTAMSLEEWLYVCDLEYSMDPEERHLFVFAIRTLTRLVQKLRQYAMTHSNLYKAATTCLTLVSNIFVESRVLHVEQKYLSAGCGSASYMAKVPLIKFDTIAHRTRSKTMGVHSYVIEPDLSEYNFQEYDRVVEDYYEVIQRAVRMPNTLWGIRGINLPDEHTTKRGPAWRQVVRSGKYLRKRLIYEEY